MKKINIRKTPTLAWLLLTVFLISVLGIIFVFEASVAEAFQQFNNQFYFAKQQAMWLLIGSVILVITSLVPISLIKKLAPVAYGLGLLLLFLVLIPGFGFEVNGAQRWLRFGSLSIQPIEVMKLSLIIYFSYWLEKHQRFEPFLFLLGLPIVLVLLQPDLGSALLLSGIGATMYFLAGGSVPKLSIAGSVGLVAVCFLILLQPYRLRRVTTFLNPELDPLGASFHIRQITIALGNGGWFGQGIGKSKQKFSYIPEASNDSIFAIYAEEIGFLGALLLLALYINLFLLGFKLAQEQTNKFGYLIISGIISWFIIQTFLNLAAVVALIPLTGMPLPFFSYGGSALVMVLCSIGILVSAVKSNK